METSPEFNQPPIDPRDAMIMAAIEAALEEYETQRREADHELANGLVISALHHQSHPRCDGVEPL